MLEGHCHCGAVRFQIQDNPERAVACNCSICRRLGTLWAHAQAKTIRLDHAPDACIRYAWGDKVLAFCSCATCGCTTHWEYAKDPQDNVMAVNLALCDPKELAAIPVRRFDGADTWAFLD